MKYNYLLLLFCLMNSCQFFQMERQTSDGILQEELKQIDWQEVDEYPVLWNCTSLPEKEHLQCLSEELHQKMKNSMQRFTKDYDIDSLTQMNIRIIIDKERKLYFSLDIDSIVFKEKKKFSFYKLIFKRD